MVENRWAMLISYSFLNFIIGLNYINSFPIVLESIVSFENVRNYNSIFKAIYPVLYVILGPISYKLLWSSLYWPIWLAWIGVMAGVWIKYFADTTFWIALTGHCLIIVSSSIIIPAAATLSIDYFAKSQQLLALSISTISNLLGIIVSLIADNYISPGPNHLIQASLVSLFGVVFLLTTEKIDKVGGKAYIGFFKSWKILLGHRERCVMFLCSSTNLGIIYTLLTLIEESMRKFLYEEYQVLIIASLFGLSGLIGALVSVCYCRKQDELPIVLRFFLVLTSVSLFWWAFCSKIPFVCIIFSVTSGFSMVGSLPMQILALLDHNPNIVQPISANLIYFTSAFLIIPLRSGFILTEENFGISGLWFLAVLELFIITSYIAEYSPNTREIKESLI